LQYKLIFFLKCFSNSLVLPAFYNLFVIKEAVLGADIMDVWLDSGVFHWYDLEKDKFS